MSKTKKQYPTPSNEETNLEFFIKNKNGVNARALYLKNGMMRVLAGSEFMSKQQNPFMSSDIENVVEVISDNICRLIEDFDFTTPSRASKVVTGTSTNGWIVWKTADGKTLDEFVRQK